MLRVEAPCLPLALLLAGTMGHYSFFGVEEEREERSKTFIIVRSSRGRRQHCGGSVKAFSVLCKCEDVFIFSQRAISNFPKQSKYHATYSKLVNAVWRKEENNH